MEKEYYQLNAGIPSLAQLETWNSFPLLPQELNSSSDFTSFCNWDKQTDHFTQFDNTLSPHVDPTSSGLRELVGKLGPICTASVNRPPVSPEVLNPPLPALSADPGFAERAARFSCFGSRSFNGRKSQIELHEVELDSPIMGGGKLGRVWSSPSLKQGENCQIQMEMKKEMNGFFCSNEGSSISDQVPSGETFSKVREESNSRKRKAVPRCKAKEDVSSDAVIKGSEGDEAKNGKRAKTGEASPSGKGVVKSEVEQEEVKDGASSAMGEQPKQDKASQKAPEPPKDFIHVRARRGQATDSHSLAERVRREKIGERMKLLQDLVPGCNKVTGKALMLDEIINYVQSLQRQVEFLSMKLASVNSRQEVNMDTYTSKDIMQPNGSLPHPLYPIDSSLTVFYGHQPKQSPTPRTIASISQCPVDPLHRTSSHNLDLQLPSLNAFVDGLPQFSAFCEDDLHSIIRMGFNQDAVREAAFSH